MPWTVDWIDEDLGIYDSTIREPFPSEEEEAFYEAWFQLVDSSAAPLYALFDVSEWGGRGVSLLDSRFLRMSRYRDKIRVIAMVNRRNQVLQMLAQVGAAMLGRRDWFQFFDAREAAIAYLRERARSERASRESAEENDA